MNDANTDNFYNDEVPLLGSDFSFQALTQERRRYGFVLERQCSLAKHYLAHHSAGVASYVRHLEDWQEVARSREYMPESVDSIFSAKLRVSIPTEEKF